MFAETDAYQRLLGNTLGTDKPAEGGDAKDKTDDDESDSEDEIEKAARITPQTPTSGNRLDCSRHNTSRFL